MHNYNFNIRPRIIESPKMDTGPSYLTLLKRFVYSKKFKYIVINTIFIIILLLSVYFFLETY